MSAINSGGFPWPPRDMPNYANAVNWTLKAQSKVVELFKSIHPDRPLSLRTMTIEKYPDAHLYLAKTACIKTHSTWAIIGQSGDGRETELVDSDEEFAFDFEVIKDTVMVILAVDNWHRKHRYVYDIEQETLCEAPSPE